MNDNNIFDDIIFNNLNVNTPYQEQQRPNKKRRLNPSEISKTPTTNKSAPTYVQIITNIIQTVLSVALFPITASISKILNYCQQNNKLVSNMHDTVCGDNNMNRVHSKYRKYFTV